MSAAFSKFSREDTLILLEYIGIPLPLTTKLSLEDLAKRLKDAFEAAQHFHTLLPTLPFNPSEHPLWPADKDLADASRTTLNFKEIVQMRISGAHSKHTARVVSSEKKDTFREMRSVVASFAQESEIGREFCMSDALGDLVNWGVYVRVTQVHCINDTPVYILLYKEVIPQPGQSLHDALDAILNHGSSSTKRKFLINIQTTAFERQSMLALFCSNAKRLASTYHPIPTDADDDNDDNAQAQQRMGLKLSFVLPLGPLDSRAIARLTSIAGCEVCGSTRNVSRCVQCLAIAYCSKECQRQDWPTHKSTCRSLKGGTWQTITVEEVDAAMLNRHDRLSSASLALSARTHQPTSTSISSGSAPPLDSDKIFLAKFQISLFAFKDAAHMLIYDRQRRLTALWRRAVERDLFDEAEESMGDALRMYRWVRRVGDTQLSVCLDRWPDKDPVW